MGWVKKLFLGACVVLLLAAIGGGYFVYAQTKSPTRAAFLTVESGLVEVNSGSGFARATDGMSLALDDTVRTGDGLATIVLFESVIVNLEPHTTVSVSKLTQDHPKIMLESGEVWNKFTGLLGVDSFDVETPTTVATVRGTEFGVSFVEEVVTVLVAEGVVGVSSEGESVELRANTIVSKILGQDMVVEALSPEERERLKARRARVVESLRRVRSAEVDKHEFLLGVANRQGVSRDDIEQVLVDIDEGRDSEDRVSGLVPVDTQGIEKIKGLNRVIREVLQEQ